MKSLIRHLANYFSVCNPRHMPEFRPKEMMGRKRGRIKQKVVVGKTFLL